MEFMTRMKRIQRSKPTVISHHDSIQWNGTIKTAIFEGHTAARAISNTETSCSNKNFGMTE